MPSHEGAARVPRSVEPVVCPVAGCAVLLSRRTSLAPHVQTEHAETHVWVADDAVAPGTVKRAADPGMQGVMAKFLKLAPQPQPPASEPVLPPPPLPAPGAGDVAGPSAADLQQQLRAVRGELAAVKAQLFNMPAAVVKAIASEAARVRRLAATARSQEVVIRGVTPAEIAANNGMEVVVTGETAQLVCVACRGRADAGRFSTAQERGIVALRRSVLRHVSSPGHITALNALHALRTARSADKQRALAVARIAYEIIKEGAPYATFPQRVFTAKLNGVDVGTMNHDVSVIPDILQHMDAELTFRLAQYLNLTVARIGSRLTPVSVAVDKATQLHRTTQMTCIIFMLAGTITYAIVSNDIAWDKGDTCDAAAAATHIIAGVASVISSEGLRKRLASLAVDGAYVAGNVPAALRLALGYEPESAWMLGRWCLAHMLELAIHDCRLNKKGSVALRCCAWYANVAVVVSLLLDAVSHGKGYEDLLALSAELKVKLLMPKRICITRFAQSELKVYSSFLRDFPILHAYYVKHSGPADADSERNAKEEAVYELSFELTDYHFVSGLLLLRDVFAKTSALSLKFQTVDTAPWDIQRAADDFLLELRRMEAETKGPAARFSVESFPLLHTVYRDNEGGGAGRTAFMDLQTFKFKGIELSCTLKDAKKGADSTRQTEEYCKARAMTDMNAFIAAFAHFYETRFVSGKGAPVQSKAADEADAKAAGDISKAKGSKKTAQRVHKDNVASRAFITTCAGCFDLRLMLPHDKRGLLIRKRVVNIGGVDAVESDQQFCSRCCNSLLKQYNGRAELGEVYEAAAEAGVWEDTGDWSAACTARSKAPTETALWEQYCEMRRILVFLRVTEPELFAIPDGKAELDSSDIKRIIFTHELFETEMEDILYLLMWCLLMSAAECVTEGASSLVDRHADPRRHLGAVQYTQGAKVQSSGPVMAEADEFLLAALQRWRPQTDAQVLRGQKGPINAFIHASTNGKKGLNAEVGLVMQGQAARASRLSFMV